MENMRMTNGIDIANMKLDLNLRVDDLDVATRWYARVFGVQPIYSGVDRTLGGSRRRWFVSALEA